MREIVKVNSAGPVRSYANHRERQVLHHLRARSWLYLNKLPVPVGKRLISSLVAKEWVELRSGNSEIRIKDAGLTAIQTAIP